MRKPRSLSRTARKVLAHIYYADELPMHGPEGMYGLQIMDLCGTPSGTLYPILARLAKRGLLTATPETIDPSEAGRPARIYYTITNAGREAHELENPR